VPIADPRLLTQRMNSEGDSAIELDCVSCHVCSAKKRNETPRVDKRRTFSKIWEHLFCYVHAITQSGGRLVVLVHSERILR
jgi:hypothetical protein